MKGRTGIEDILLNHNIRLVLVCALLFNLNLPQSVFIFPVFNGVEVVPFIDAICRRGSVFHIEDRCKTFFVKITDIIFVACIIPVRAVVRFGIIGCKRETQRAVYIHIAGSGSGRFKSGHGGNTRGVYVGNTVNRAVGSFHNAWVDDSGGVCLGAVSGIAVAVRKVKWEAVVPGFSAIAGYGSDTVQTAAVRRIRAVNNSVPGVCGSQKVSVLQGNQSRNAKTLAACRAPGKRFVPREVFFADRDAPGFQERRFCGSCGRDGQRQRRQHRNYHSSGSDNTQTAFPQM